MVEIPNGSVRTNRTRATTKRVPKTPQRRKRRKKRTPEMLPPTVSWLFWMKKWRLKGAELWL